MDGFDGLSFLLITSILLSITLTFISQASLGRGLGDLERQMARHIDGGPRIQSWANLRMHLNRVLFGAVFVIINIALVAGVPEVWRMWSFRVLWNLLLIAFVVSAILDWQAERALVQLGIKLQADEHANREILAQEAESRRITDLASDQASYIQITEQAVSDLELAVQKSGVSMPSPLVDVVPEHSSPVTAQQRETAKIQSLRARLVRARLALGLEPPKTQGVPDGSK